MAAVPAGCSRGPWDWWEWQKRDQPRVLPRPSSRVPLARTNFWLSLLGLLAKIKCSTTTTRIVRYGEEEKHDGGTRTGDGRWFKEEEHAALSSCCC